MKTAAPRSRTFRRSLWRPIAGVLAAILLEAWAAVADQPAPVVVITTLGDSVTAGYGASSPDMTYPSQMAALLDAAYPEKLCEVHNRGVGGYRAEDVLAQLQSQGLPYNPDFVLLMIGGNDLNNGGGIDETVGEVQQIVDWLNANSDAKIIVSTFIPNLLYGTLGSWWISLYNAALLDPQKLSGYDMIFTTNWEDLYDSGAGHAKTWLMADSVHPNDDGYAYMAENWYEALGTFPELTDSDGDTIYDDEEDSDGDGVWDQVLETNFQSADTDGDGLSDYIEVRCSGVSTALDQLLRPSTFCVNFQPLRSAAPAAYAIDGGGAYTATKGLGW